jgi:hypothetical protein
VPGYWRLGPDGQPQRVERDDPDWMVGAYEDAAAQAREALRGVLEHLPAGDGKQRTIILGDLAAVETADGKVEEACRWANEALDQLSLTWYATCMDRIRDVRKRLHASRNETCVHELDDRMYGWGATVSALRR